MTDIYAHSALPPWVTLYALFFSIPPLLVAIILCFTRARRRTQLAATSEASISDTPPPLVEGKDVVLSGVVRHLEDHEVAVKVAITQRGEEAESSGSWTHSWTEIDREIVLAPFLLELANGEMVRVDPPKNVAVADDLDEKVWIDRNERILSAELVAGEQIFARGRLERSDQALPASAYRDVQWGWALRASEGQMLLSSEPLGAGMRSRAKFHRGFGHLAIAFFLVTQLTLVPYYMRALGSTHLEKISAKGEYDTVSDGKRTTHYGIRVRGLKIDIDQEDYPRVEQGTAIAVRYASGANWNLGSEPTLQWWHGLALVIASITFWVWYRVRRAGSRPWFRRKVNESGSGRLPDVE